MSKIVSNAPELQPKPVEKDNKVIGPVSYVCENCAFPMHSVLGISQTQCVCVCVCVYCNLPFFRSYNFCLIFAKENFVTFQIDKNCLKQKFFLKARDGQAMRTVCPLPIDWKIFAGKISAC